MKKLVILLAGSYSSWCGNPLAFLMNAFELWGTDYLTAKDQTVHFTANTDAFREGLKYVNHLFEEGLISEETYVQDTTQMKMRVNHANLEEVTVGMFPTPHVAQYVDISVMPDCLINYAPFPPLEGPTGLRQAEK